MIAGPSKIIQAILQGLGSPTYVEAIWTFFLFSLRFYLFIYFRENGGTKRGTETSMWERNIKRLPLIRAPRTQNPGMIRNATRDLLLCGTMPNQLSQTGQGRLDIPNVLLWRWYQRDTLSMTPCRTKAVTFQRNLWLTDLNSKKIRYANHMQLSPVSQSLSFFFSKKSLVGHLLYQFCPTVVELRRMAYKNTRGSRCKWNIEGQREECSSDHSTMRGKVKTGPQVSWLPNKCLFHHCPTFPSPLPLPHTPFNSIPTPIQAATASTEVLSGTAHFL